MIGEIYRAVAAERVVPAAGIGGDGAENSAMSEYKTNPRVSWAICWPLRRRACCSVRTAIPSHKRGRRRWLRPAYLRGAADCRAPRISDQLAPPCMVSSHRDMKTLLTDSWVRRTWKLARGSAGGRAAADIHGAETQKHVDGDFAVRQQHTRMMADGFGVVQSKESMGGIEGSRVILIA